MASEQAARKQVIEMERQLKAIPKGPTGIEKKKALNDRIK
jgi:hypothetical protein